MAGEQWLVIYRNYTADELAREIADLKAKKTLYSQQTVGNQSGVFDLQQLETQLYAATLVQNERTGPAFSNRQVGTFDFRDLQL